MSTIDQTAEVMDDRPGPEPSIVLDLSLQEAEALRVWLLKAGVDGSTALDEPFVSATLTKLGRAVDVAQATENVRRELGQAGLDVGQLSDEEVRELGRRISDAAAPAMRA
jgi:hypothetical protein